MPDLNKPVPRGTIPYGFHVKVKNCGDGLITDFIESSPLNSLSFKVLYGIQDNRRSEEMVTFSEIEEWWDQGIGEGAFFKWGGP